MLQFEFWTLNLMILNGVHLETDRIQDLNVFCLHIDATNMFGKILRCFFVLK